MEIAKFGNDENITLFSDISEENQKKEIKTEDTQDSEPFVIKNKFELAWRCLMPTFLPKCILESKRNGPGVNYFSYVMSDDYMKKKREFISTSFGRVENKSNLKNCEYNYICKNSYHWNLLIVPNENYLDLMKNYNDKENILVAIHIPIFKKTEIQNITAYL